MTETINNIASAWFTWQWAMLWQVAILIGVVAVIDRLIRKRAWPQLRYALWLLVLVKLVLPPTLTSPLSLTSQIPAWTQVAVEAGTSTQIPPVASQTMNRSPGVSSVPSLTTETKAAEAPSAPATVRAPTPTLSWTAYALGMWLAGVVMLAAGLCIRLRQMAREHAGTPPQEVPVWFDRLLAETAAELHLRRVPRVVFSSKVCCPAVFGVLRPVLLFPADQVPMIQREARHILLHELAHIRRGDLLVHAGYMILVTVYWFNPLLWLMRRHMQNLRELCCDATVATHLKEETAAYRETLLATGRALLARPVDPGLGLVGLFENSGWLLVRLQWLEKKTWRHPWLRRTLVGTVVILMLCCIVPMASVQAADPETGISPYRVTLSDGSTVELIGVRKKDFNEWWRPDGAPLAEAPYDASAKTNLSDAYEFALRCANLPQGSSGVMGTDPGGSSWGGSIPMWYTQVQKAGKPVEGVTYIVTKLPAGTETVTVQVQLATGDWRTDATNRRTDHGWYAWTGGGHVLSGVIFSVPYERDGKSHATVTYGARRPPECDVRLTALDANGVEHTSDYLGGLWTPAGFAQITPEFDLPLEEIVAFHLQTRPYTWVEFRNVSLRPGRQQKIETVIREPNEPGPNGSME